MKPLAPRSVSKPPQDEPPFDPDDFWRVAVPQAEPLGAKWFVPLVLLILVLATPWYLPTTFAAKLFGGLPVWVWTALGGGVALALLTSYGAVALWRDDDSLGVSGKPLGDGSGHSSGSDKE